MSGAKVAVVGFLVMLWPTDAAAQSVEFGAKGGITFATVTGGAQTHQEYGGFTEEHTPGLGGAVGVAFAFRFGSVFALQPEVLFVD